MKMNKNFYTIYKKNGTDLKPLANFDDQKEVLKYLNIGEREFRKIKENSKKIWYQNEKINSKILIFKDAI